MILVTAEEAAAEADVETATIYVWKNRGYLTPAGKRGRQLLFRLSDVFECEAKRKHKHRRKCGPLLVPLGGLLLGEGLLVALGRMMEEAAGLGWPIA